MKTGVFTLQGPLEGKTLVILDKYSFVDGKMHVSETDAILMRQILCNHYGCDLAFEQVEAQESQTDVGEGSLAVESTKLGKTIGDLVTEQTLKSNLANAQAVQDDKKGA